MNDIPENHDRITRYTQQTEFEDATAIDAQELLGKELLLVDAEFGDTENYGDDVAVLIDHDSFDEQREWYTTSKVIVDQLKSVDAEDGFPVVAELHVVDAEKGSYYTFS